MVKICLPQLTLLSLSVLSQVASGQTIWSMGYWEGGGGAGPPSAASITWAGLTHLVYWNVVSPKIDPSGNYMGLTLTCFDGSTCQEAAFASEQKVFARTAHANGVKVVFEIPDIPGSTYASAIRSNLKGFVDDFLKVMHDSDYDGVSFDWENHVDFSKVRKFVVALRNGLPKGKLLISTGFDTKQWISGWSQGSPATYTYLDRYNEMTYDWAGPWEPVSWFNSALHGDNSCGNLGCAHWDVTRENFVKAGWPVSKINFGIPFYGYKVEGVASPRIAGASYNLVQVTYTQIVRSYPYFISRATFDNVAHECWFGIKGGYITYDSPQAVIDKASYAKAHGLGGVFMFSLNKDELRFQSPQHPLLAAVASILAVR